MNETAAVTETAGVTDTKPKGTITVSISDGVAAVQIENASRRNALTKAMCIQLQELMPTLDEDPRVSLVTLRGVGSIFSAGANIGDLASVILDRQDDGTVIDHLSQADGAIAAVAKPTIALVDGACMGGGWQIASACDFIIASERSVFAITPSKIGIIYPRPGIERLVRQVGLANAKFILLTADTFSATRAQALGLVAETVPDDEFEARCTALIDSIRSRSKFSQHSMKQLVDLAAANDPQIDEHWDAAWAAMTESPDMQIGINAFLHRQAPQFTWRPAGGGQLSEGV
ncbi:enoyl-CoA hydratase/isomerase family protein [Subtercola lobariae]|uniref:Crotonase n=1 Tax=Subtercola lobariae TaxID=1588641 RepID=A0A917BA95_9MICO|nr:enoyl-CoA hydratase/isomerase family protein [Subtercola lobariae]GGF30802.1 crotonase [Subtercola lobariae]